MNVPCHDSHLALGRWTTPEDALLITAVRRHGRHWYKVAELLPGRTDDQCAKRWREKLDPSIRQSLSSWPLPLLSTRLTGRDAWTEVEDSKLLEILQKHGKRWNIISGCIKGRPAVQCRNRFLSLQRAGRVSEDGKVSPSTTADHSPTSDAKNVRFSILHTRARALTNAYQLDGFSDRATMAIDARLEPSVFLSTDSPSPPPPCPSSPSSASSAEPVLPALDPISAAASPPPAPMECLGPAQISAESHGMSTFHLAERVLS